ncbi:MAG: tyrosine-type recombinase/integrase, partial [Candidatus Acidiferrales bacterium]
VKTVGLNPREFVLYALRHTCLTRWGNSGMDAWTLARLAGHSNIRQSMTYVHPSDRALHAAIDRMSNDNGQGGDKIGDIAELPVPNADTKLLVHASQQKP